MSQPHARLRWEYCIYACTLILGCSLYGQCPIGFVLIDLFVFGPGEVSGGLQFEATSG